jgi:hypothetical protein
VVDMVVETVVVEITAVVETEVVINHFSEFNTH